MSANLPQDDPDTLDSRSQQTRYGRPSERIFRRSRAARERRIKADKADIKAIAMILQLCVLIALIIVGAGVAVQTGMIGGASSAQQGGSAIASWASPWVLGLSKIEVIGVALIMGLSVFLLRRWRKQG